MIVRTNCFKSTKQFLQSVCVCVSVYSVMISIHPHWLHHRMVACDKYTSVRIGNQAPTRLEVIRLVEICPTLTQAAAAAGVNNTHTQRDLRCQLLRWRRRRRRRWRLEKREANSMGISGRRKRESSDCTVGCTKCKIPLHCNVCALQTAVTATAGALHCV